MLSFYPSIWSWEFVLGCCSTSIFHIRTLALKWLVSYIVLFIVFLLMLLEFNIFLSFVKADLAFETLAAFHILHALILLVEKQNNAHRYTNLFTSSNLMLLSLLVGFLLGLFSCSYFCWHLSFITEYRSKKKKKIFNGI